jgi:hypothetical protein
MEQRNCLDTETAWHAPRGNGDVELPPCGAQNSTMVRPFAPIFVVGCERSGTTFLAVLLGRHSTVAMTPETHFFLRVAPRQFRAHHSYESHGVMVRKFFESPRAADFDLPEAAVLERFSSYPPTYAALFEVILSLYAERAGKPRGAEKTPFHLRRVPQILDAYPNAKIVGIVRDGRDVVRSIMNAPWTAHASLRRQCLKWNRAVAAGQRWQQRFPDQFMQIRYEDLVLDTEQTLRAVDEFCALPFEGQQLDPERATGVVPPRERGWKANAERLADPARVSAWQHQATPTERYVMNTMMGRRLAALGYGDRVLPPLALPLRFLHRLANAACRIGLYRIYFNTIGRYTPSMRQLRRTDRFRPGVFESPAPADPLPAALSD